MMTCRINRKNTGSRGVAIVIVLGLIAVLMMMAVAFSIHMRIERTGAANYRYGVQARHMVYAGLASAIRDIDGHMKDNAGQPLIYPDWTVESSTGGLGKASVLSFATAQYLPVPLQELARTNNATWTPITDDSGNQRGRYAFVIVNSSGLLDVNKVGGWARGGGTNSSEIQLAGVPGVTDAIQLVERAYQDGRYETFSDFIINNSFAGDGSSFSTFSLSPNQKYYDIDEEKGEKARIDLDVSQWNADVETKIKEALTLAGVTQIDRVYGNMKDWADADSLPIRLDEACGEAVPMINEVVVSNDIRVASSGTFRWVMYVDVESAYPFERTSEDNFIISIDVESANMGGAGTDPNLLPDNMNDSQPINTPSLGFRQHRFRKITTGVLSITNPPVMNVQVDVRARVALSSGAVVDEVPSPYAAPTPAGFRVRGTIPFDTNVRTQQWAECVDCRFNWAYAAASGSNGRMWERDRFGKLTSPSMGAINGLTTNVLAGGDVDRQGNYDEYFQGFVGNRPFTRVGELGSIVMAPLTTIRLYDHGFAAMHNGEKEYHKVLDYFTASSNQWRRGLVNINTLNTGVLAAAFSDCPLDEEDPLSPRLAIDDPATPQNDSWDMAEYLIAGRLYTNLSEIGAFTNWVAYTQGGNGSDFERESLIRNTAGLLTARDNYFTIILRADSFSAGIGGTKGMSLATSRAVAEIWRDPIPDENGNHKSFVRSFRFVED